MILNMACIVEGHGDVLAVPLLLRRLQAELRPNDFLSVLKPIRVPRYRLVKPSELENKIDIAARQITPPRAILVLIDAEDDCPAITGPELLRRVQQARPDLPVGLVLAKFEFESWFLAALESLAGRRRLKSNLTAPADPEAIRDAKKALASHLSVGTYSETVDQPALAALFDLRLARSRSPAFDKCCREFVRLFDAAGGPRSQVPSP